MKITLSCLILLFTLSIHSQEKGVSPIHSPPAGGGGQEGATYAVVVGISDYQDDNIPDLRFADKDAEAFAAYLQSPAGGAVPSDHIIILKNEKATNARIADALIWMLEESKPGDRAVIYFSGHGDVETITRFNRGYLLTYDSPPKIYMAGAFNIRDLQDIISTLSDNEVQVVMISDACRAGKLAGTDVGGTQATAQNLSQQFANEVKILSCQPNEFSLEGEQWGGGRGAFSYHLLDGLNGLADKNGDAQVNLFEIGRYLEDMVPTETAPHNQMPFTVGDRNAHLASVDAASLAQLQEMKANEQQYLSKIETKGMEELLLAKVDSNIQEMYASFVAALDNKQLLEPEGKSAYDLYQVLSQKAEIKDLHNIMRRNLSVALQEDAQQAVNAYLAANPDELQRRYSNDQDYRLYPRYLEKACELLGSQHFYYNNLMAKKYYFEGLGLRLAGANYNEAIQHQLKALEYQKRAPYILNELGVLYTELRRGLQAIEYLERAIEVTPTWGLPYINICSALARLKRYDEALEYGHKAIELMPNNSAAYNFLAWFYTEGPRYDDRGSSANVGTDLEKNLLAGYDNMNTVEQSKKTMLPAIRLLEKAIEMKPDFFEGHVNLGNIYFLLRESEKSIEAYLKALVIKPDDARIHSRLGDVYGQQLSDFDEAEKHFLKGIELDSTIHSIYNQLGLLYINFSKYDEAEKVTKKAIAMNPRDIWPKHNLATVYRHQSRINEAEALHLKALSMIPDYPPSYRVMSDLYLEMNRVEDAEFMLKKGLELKPDYIRLVTSLTWLYSQKGEVEKGEAYIQMLLEIEPNNPSYLAMMEILYFHLGDLEKAREYSNKVEEMLDYKGSQIHNLAMQYHKAKYYEKAIYYFKKDVELRPDDNWNEYNISCGYALWGKSEEALDWLSKAIEKKEIPFNKIHTDHDLASIRDLPYLNSLMEKHFPGQVFEKSTDIVDNSEPVYFPANCIKLAKFYEGQGEQERANFLYEKTIALKPDTLTNNLALAKAAAYLKLDRLEEARAICPESIDSENPEELLEAGKLFYLLGKSKQAATYFDNYLIVSKSMTPENEVALFYKKHGEFAPAEPLFKITIEKLPEGMQYRRSLARLYFFFGKKDKAFEVLQEAIALDPDAEFTHAVYCMLSYYNQPKEAKPIFEKYSHLPLWDCLELMRSNQFEKADTSWQELQEQYDFWWLEFTKYKYLTMKIRQGKMDRALQLLEEMLVRGVFDNYQLYKTDKELDPIRNDERYKALMRKYFPEKTNQ